MRLVIVLMTIACLQVSASAFSQKITLAEKNAPLGQVLDKIQSQSGYLLFYNNKLIKTVGNVTIDLHEATVQQAMDGVLKDFPLTYSVVDNTIVIKQKETPPVEKPAAPAQPTDIIGHVTNDHNQPLDGASVTLKRTQSGTLTNANGDFTLRNVYPTDTLVIGYIGYGRTYIPVGNQKLFKIALKEATNQLDQVVVQAYGNTSQRLATGDIGTVSAKDIEKQPSMNVIDALQGQVAGVVVTNNNGYATGAVKIEIRGHNSIDPSIPSDPLYVIDGVPLTTIDLGNGNGSSYGQGSQGLIGSGIPSPATGQSPFASLNPQDVESITVLKDADATALYGSRGANGVIIITTKKGKAGKTKLQASATEGFLQVPRYFDMLNTQQYVTIREEALRNDGLPINIQTAPDLVQYGTSSYTNWQKYLWGHVGKQYDAQLSLTGGDQNTTFRLSGGFHDEKDVTTYSGDNRRASFSFNLNHKSSDQKFEVSLTGGYSTLFTDMVFLPGLSTTLPPNAPPFFNSAGGPNFAGYAIYQYPAAQLFQPYSAQTNLLYSNLVISRELAKGLKLRVSLGYNNSYTVQTQLTPVASQNPNSSPTGQSQVGTTLSSSIIAEPQLEYSRQIGKGKLNVFGGASYQPSSSTTTYLGGYGFTNDLTLSSVGTAPHTTLINNTGQLKFASLLGRLNYNWADKYILNVNFRRDGSSLFGPAYRYGNFGSVGAAWLFTEEKWAKKALPFLSFGKLRSSYGATGSDPIPAFAYESLSQFTGSNYNNQKGLSPERHSDSTLHWEVNKKLEAALDLGFWNDRINFTAAWYRNRCNDQLVGFPTPNFTGFSYVTTNSPADVQNTGWEFNWSGKWFTGNFNWTSSFEISFNRNKLLAYPNLAQSPYAGLYTIGQPLNIVKDYQSIGVDPLTGQYALKDFNGDGQIGNGFFPFGAYDDRQDIIDLSPKYEGSFTNNFQYKNFTLSVLLYFKKQLGFNVLESLGSPPGNIGNMPVDVLSRWQKPGDITTVGKATTMSTLNYSYYQGSSANITDASFIRVQNVEFAYTFPDRFSKRLGLANFKIYARGQNLYTFTGYKGIDPETEAFGSMPKLRIITAGITLTL